MNGCLDTHGNLVGGPETFQALPLERMVMACLLPPREPPT